jgi:hypothetical protein
MEKLKFEVHGTKNFSDKERNKFNEALVKTEHALNHKEFDRRILAHKFEQQNSKSNYEILLMLKSGADKFNTLSDKDLDVYITLYYSRKNTIGYTYPNTYWTWINRKFFSSFNHASIGGNVVHEYVHNLGFGHRSPKDSNSVPYAIGYIVRDMILEMEKYGKYLEPDTVQPVPTETDTPPVVTKPKISFWSKISLFFKRLF